MRAYRIFIDDIPALEGTLLEGLDVPAEVAWGDLASAESLSLWGYVEYGITARVTPGDLNCDGLVNAFDIDPFVLALLDIGEWDPDCDRMAADINGDGVVNAFDIDPFVGLLTGMSQ